MKKVIITIIQILLVCFSKSYSQNGKQNIRGIVYDKVSEKPLPGATVSVLHSNAAVIADSIGQFLLANAQTGRITLVISFQGYKQAVIPEILVTAGKENFLEIGLEQEIKQMNEVVVKSSRPKKGNPYNEFATVSARSFTVEEITRFAGGRNDPAKLVSNYAGVVANSDARNDIVVRGNSPAGVLWKVEGIASPNPNHFSTLGTTGGPVSALNTNSLKTSDFYMGAFPAEFGNAISAVFDIQLRSGNTQKAERTFQINAFSGFEAMLEGPLNKSKNGSSYLLGFRYSFVKIAGNLGLNIGTKAIPDYKDFVYNIQFAKGKAGKINLFGFGGWSKIDFIGKELDSTDFFSRQDQDIYNGSHFFNFGAKHTIDIGKRSYLKTVVSWAEQNSDAQQYQYPQPIPPYINRWLITDAKDQNNTIRFSSFLNTKVNSRLFWRAGLSADFIHLKSKVLYREGLPSSAQFKVVRNFEGDLTLMQAFIQGNLKLSKDLSLIGGLHYMYLTFNEHQIFEPRLSFKYNISTSNTLSIGYGLHGQMQPLPVYFFNTTANGAIDESNRLLNFTRANHYVFSFEHRFKRDWRFKIETYYQKLSKVPVDRFASGFSLLNAGDNFAFPDRTGLINKGSGINKGVETSVERFLTKEFYFLASASIFSSKYKGSDGIERNSSFNYKYAGNILAGYEYKIGKAKSNALTIDIRLSSIGGRYTTPINIDSSIIAGKEILDELRFNTIHLAGYFRFDTKFGLRINSHKRKISQTIYIDLQNVTNKKNIFLQRYNAEKRTLGNVYQIGFFPDILYKVEF